MAEADGGKDGPRKARKTIPVFSRPSHRPWKSIRPHLGGRDETRAQPPFGDWKNDDCWGRFCMSLPSEMLNAAQSSCSLDDALMMHAQTFAQEVGGRYFDEPVDEHAYNKCKKNGGHN